jgi:hypothetical protein
MEERMSISSVVRLEIIRRHETKVKEMKKYNTNHQKIHQRFPCHPQHPCMMPLPTHTVPYSHPTTPKSAKFLIEFLKINSDVN